jgi:hypothetical protein
MVNSDKEIYERFIKIAKDINNNMLNFGMLLYRQLTKIGFSKLINFEEIMENLFKEFEIEITKFGLPAIWEQGGMKIHKGYALIITNKSGQPKTPIYIKHKDNINGKHALFVVKIGDHLIECTKTKKEYPIKVYQIVKIDLDELKVYCNLIKDFDDSLFVNAIDAAYNKAGTIKCTKVFFSKQRKLDEKFIKKHKKENYNV